MKNILILGANGQIAQLVIQNLLIKKDFNLTLYLRNASRIQFVEDDRLNIIEADVNDYPALSAAMVDQDLVYANLGGVFEPMAVNIVNAMQETGVKRLIFVSGLGLYREVPEPFGSWVEESVGHEIMEDTRRAAFEIESSTVNYTIIRAAYMSNEDHINYELTKKGEPFKGTIISRKSIADLIVKIVNNPELYKFSSVGISQPGTDGPVPMY
ncbi:hypothetical protein FC70_GL001480 [Paucilactobacillus oligofermentans DSM 15707 = LMG 22743]|uniref:NAD(P)-binding domain-containing protein n=1 Tax=Paucilactobacillus oligofermentans DSM 15707 = LMG 22743 TaxID=1423778 RepID=A0A0R1RIQ3_9LACO|nr:NAD(P)H-binding protein [Paucilactobacillus oligofermentans]KRL54682.1 hypothetical protein FC70_GL001480 [Paucilactobacillus oligofermentans DSM 15707 = LMG 22743]CUS26408.1 NADH(P)-binding domain-containing protein [Paucilactobacillus oligofermentans DSM 15707 = LMG 22743]